MKIRPCPECHSKDDVQPVRPEDRDDGVIRLECKKCGYEGITRSLEEDVRYDDYSRVDLLDEAIKWWNIKVTMGDNTYLRCKNCGEVVELYKFTIIDNGKLLHQKEPGYFCGPVHPYSIAYRKISVI